jgi:predicted PurR-regulated permease PerM
MILPWLLPLGLLGTVLVVTFAPGWLLGIVGLIAATLLAYVGVPLYWRFRQGRGDGSGESQ